MIITLAELSKSVPITKYLNKRREEISKLFT